MILQILIFFLDVNLNTCCFVTIYLIDNQNSSFEFPKIKAGYQEKMNHTTAAYWIENAQELANRLTTTYFIEEIVLAQEEDEEWCDWMDEIKFVIERLCNKDYSMTGDERFWFSEEKFCCILDNEANWGIIDRVIFFFHAHDIIV